MLLLLALLSDHGDTLRHIFRPPPVDVAARVDKLVGDALPGRRNVNATKVGQCADALRAAAAYGRSDARDAGPKPLATSLRTAIDKQCQSLLVD